MRALWLLVVLLPACQPKSSDDTVDTDVGDTNGDDTDTSGGDDTDTDVAPVECHLVDGIDATGDAFPGGVVALSVVDGGSGRTYDVAWELPDDGGPATSATGASVGWTVGPEHDPFLPEDVTVTATATSPGCVDETVSTTVTLAWPENRRVVVVYNPNVDGSEAVADYYADFRQIPADALCAVPSSDKDYMAGADYPAWIAAVQACADAVGPQVEYVVPVYGVPYKVTDRIDDIAGSGSKWTVSVDALAVLGADSASYGQAIYNPIAKMTGNGSNTSKDSAWEDYEPIEAIEADLGYPYWLVTRIDGASAEAAMDLVDRTQAAEALADAGALAGTVYVDGKYPDPPATDDWGSYEGGEWNMRGTEAVFDDFGKYTVVADYNYEEFGTAPAPLECPDALYYAGWYSYYNYNDVFTWNTGAIGGHLDSCSACDIRGTSNAWAGMALVRGITATFGAVSEPYVAGMPEYDQFFLYLTQGGNFAEAGYESTYVGLWTTVFVGDPLYRPYRQ